MPFSFDRLEPTPETRDQMFNASWRSSQVLSTADAAATAPDVVPPIDPSGANQSAAWAATDFTTDMTP